MNKIKKLFERLNLLKGKSILKIILIVFIFNNFSYSSSYSWYRLPNSPYKSSGFENIYFLNENTGWLIHLNGLVYRTQDGGNNWIMQDSIYLGNFTSVLFINENTGFITSRKPEYKLFKTIDGGFNWNIVSNFPSPVPYSLEMMHSIRSDNFLYGCGYYADFANFIKSTDKGNTWTTKDLSSMARGLTDCYFIDQNTGIVVGVTGASSQLWRSIVLRTTDGGESWSTQYSGDRIIETAIKLSFPDPQNGFVALQRLNSPEKFFIKTNDGGISWTEMPFVNANETGIGFINENTGWISGVFNMGYTTTNGGQNWINANIGLHISNYKFFGDTLGFACGQYVFKYSKTTGITQISYSVPYGFSLSQNYPNPFNPSTIIVYDLPKKEFVSLKIFDISGKELMSLVNKLQSPGSYKIVLESNNLSSGTYFYRIEAGDFKMTKKMILIR